MTQQTKKRTKDNIFNDTDSKHLSIQISLDGFSFCVLNKNKKEFQLLHEYRFQDNSVRTPHNLLARIEEIFAENKALSLAYSSVSVCHINNLSTFVPKSLFDKNKLSSYVQYNNKVFEHDFFAHDEIENHDIINVYIPYVNLNNFFIDQFGGFEYRHYSSILVSSLFNVYKYSLEPQMFAHINHNHFELVVIKDRKLQLYNSFKFKSKEDFIYYILFTAEQLKLNPEQFKLHLLGRVTKDDELYSISYKYVRNVAMLENRSNYTFIDSITEKDKREHFTLLNIL